MKMMRKRDTRSLKMDKNDMEITKKGKGRGRNGRTRTINNDLEGPITFSGTRTGKGEDKVRARTVRTRQGLTRMETRTGKDEEKE